MRLISSLAQHPEVRKERFPERLWPRGTDPREVDEGWIFLEFAEAARLRLGEPPRHLQYPFPDLQCMINGKVMLFELGEILESDLGEGVAYSGKQGQKKMEAMARGDTATAASIQTAGMRSFPANASLDRMLRQKLAKQYETGGLPCHLLLFYDQQRPWGPFDYLLQSPMEFAALIRQSVFKRVWVFYLPSATLIGYLEHSHDGTLRTVFDQRFHFDFRAPFRALVPGGGERPDEIKTFVPALTRQNH